MFEHMQNFHVERLFALHLWMKSIPRKSFNFGQWCHETSCGTVACVLGHAGLIPKFRRLGLKSSSNTVKFELKNSVDLEHFNRIVDACLSKNPYPHERAYVIEHMIAGTRAGAVFFGLTMDQASCLFIAGGSYSDEDSPQSVAKTLLAVCRLQNPRLTARLEKKKSK